ncbi:MAG TPA: DinB family protein [Vicinamibacterales bacterium]|nr:DinB family protein [Vicinamibacterales bacterium]
MAMIDSFLQELEHEAKTTRRVLERVPNNQLGWRPHPKSRTLGELALHIAGTPGEVAKLAAQSEIQAPDFKDAVPTSAAELIPALDESIATARQLLGKMDDATLNGTWRVKRNGQEVLAMPRAALLRSIMLNHWYHHRGQLSVYLRELGVPVPSIYGPSADENPFS